MSKLLSYSSSSKERHLPEPSLRFAFHWAGGRRKIAQYASHLKLPFGSKLNSHSKNKIDLDKYKEQSEFRLSGSSSDQF